MSALINTNKVPKLNVSEDVKMSSSCNIDPFQPSVAIISKSIN